MTTQKSNPTPLDNPFSEPGFEVRSSCGRAWFVPLEKVREDYINFLMKADSIDNAAARQKATENESVLPKWFCEQFGWSDIVQYGRLIKNASEKEIEFALDNLRDNAYCGPTDNYTAHGIPDEQ